MTIKLALKKINFILSILSLISCSGSLLLSSLLHTWQVSSPVLSPQWAQPWTRLYKIFSSPIKIELNHKTVVCIRWGQADKEHGPSFQLKAVYTIAHRVQIWSYVPGAIIYMNSLPRRKFKTTWRVTHFTSNYDKVWSIKIYSMEQSITKKLIVTQLSK